MALRFYGNSSLGYDNTGLIADDSATRISLVFNPSETTGLMLHSSAGGDGQLALSLENGSVVFETEVGGVEGVEHVSTEPGVIQKDTWYQLYATRYHMVVTWGVMINSHPRPQRGRDQSAISV